ncbi:MAG: replication-relaxation family protein [Planctomycetaceae bacterium]|nr:replication-relaxation family protein [Planctomycetaceae bacterium]
MVLQERDIKVLAALSRYFILNSRQIREICFPDDSAGRITRRRLSKLMHAGYVRKRNMQVVNPADGSATPVYHLTNQGREFLAGHFDDDTFLTKPLEPSQPQHLYHYVAVAETHRLFDRAIASASGEAKLIRWVNEDEFVNPDEPDASKRRLLRANFDSRIVCLPDAAFVLRSQDQNAVFYLEQDRDTFFHDRVAARKSPGYQKLLASAGHRQHFPESELPFFYVLVMTPTAKRAEQLRRAFAKRNRNEDVQKTYRFGSFEELNEHNLLFEPLLSCCHRDDRVPLIKRVASPNHTPMELPSQLSQG